jgi:hypothetical protein
MQGPSRHIDDGRSLAVALVLIRLAIGHDLFAAVADKRRQLVTLTAPGKVKLEAGPVLWQKARHRFEIASGSA